MSFGSGEAMRTFRSRSLSTAGVAICGAMALLAAGAVYGKPTFPAVIVLGLVATIGAILFAANWPRLVMGLVVVDLLIPEDGRYTIGHIGFQLEPYRAVVGLMLIGWIIALLVDPRQRARRTRFDAPIALIVFAVLGSEVINAGRFSGVSSFAVKALWLLASLMLLLYMTVSVIRTRAQVQRLLSTLVYSGCGVAIGAVMERKTHYNVFDHLHQLLPFLTYNPGLDGGGIIRDGSLRALSSAGHPIELGNELGMLIPLAVYLAISRRQRRWLVAISILLCGDLASGSRTGIVAVVVMVIVFLCMRRRETLRFWPMVLPIAVVAHFFVPGAIGGVWAGFFPKGGLLAQQSHTFVSGGNVLLANRASRWGPELHAFAAQGDPLFGEGYGTRVVGMTTLPSPGGGKPTLVHLAGGYGFSGDNAIVLDDQWLKSLLETGVLGVMGWLWLFGSVIRKLGKRAKLERGTPEGWLPVAIASASASFVVSVLTYDAFSFVQAMVVQYLLIALASVILWLPPQAAGTVTLPVTQCGDGDELREV